MCGPFALLTLSLLGGIAEIWPIRHVTIAWSVCVSSVTLVRPSKKPLDGMRCHLAGILVWSQAGMLMRPAELKAKAEGRYHKAEVEAKAKKKL